MFGFINRVDKVNQTDCRADTTAEGLFIWVNISTSTTSLL